MKAGEGRDPADEQEGVGGKVQEVCPAGRRQRAQKELPWRAQGVRRSRGLLGVHGSADDGDVRLARSQDAGAYIAKANRDKLAISGMEKIEAYDQMENIADLAMPIDQNRIVTFESNRRKKP